MSGLEELVQAAMAAPGERREEALRLLQGQPPKAEPYLTLRDVSQRLRLGESTLHRWKVPSHDLGGRRRYRLSEVEAYLQSKAFQRHQAALRAQRRETVQPQSLLATGIRPANPR